jgi:hypothetical protein
VNYITSVVDADFNNSGAVDGSDFLIWQRNVGATSATNAQGDTDGNGVVNGVDLANWRARYGLPSAAASAAAIPEPATSALVITAVASLLHGRRKGRAGAAAINKLRTP